MPGKPDAMTLWQTLNRQGKYVCYGIDPKQIDSLPEEALVHYTDGSINVEDSLVRFGYETAAAVSSVVGYFKPNIAFWAKFKEPGLRALRRLIQLLKENFPEKLVIIDAKRNDIGETAKQAAEEIFGYGCDAVTVNPYLGWDGVEPFVAYRDKMVVLLVRTSNKSAAVMQDLPVLVDDALIDSAAEVAKLDPAKIANREQIRGKRPYYMWVAWQVANIWNMHGNCAVVIGATAPEQMAELVEILGDVPILSPGFGKQGASVEKIVPAAINGSGQLNIIANSSSGIMYAFKEERYGDKSYQEAAYAATCELAEEIAKWRRVALTKRIMTSVGALLHGHFVLKAGDHSDYYLNKDQATIRPLELEQLAMLMAEMLDGIELDVVVGPAYGAIGLSVELARALNHRRNLSGEAQILAIPAVKDGDGFALRPETIPLVDGKKAAVAEDIVTTGSSAKSVSAMLASHGARVVVVADIWNRGGVNAEGVGAEMHLSLVDEKLPKYPEAECPLCADKVHISTNVGHGAKYLLDHDLVNCDNCGKLHKPDGGCNW